MSWAHNSWPSFPARGIEGTWWRRRKRKTARLWRMEVVGLHKLKSTLTYPQGASKAESVRFCCTMVGKEGHWKAKLGDMWARLKKERRFKCGRTKAVVGGTIIQILRKTIPAEQKQ